MTSARAFLLLFIFIFLFILILSLTASAMKQSYKLPELVRSILFWITLGIMTQSGTAHQFWIEPMAYNPPVAQLIPVSLLVGDGFPGESYPRNYNHINKFVSEADDGVRPIPGFPNQDPAGFFAGRIDGLHVIRYSSNDTETRLDARTFNQYLREEGHLDLLEARQSRGEGQLDVVENFRRCAAAYVWVGTAEEGSVPAASLELELVPDNAVMTSQIGPQFAGRLVAGGSPCPGRLVKFFHESTEQLPVFTKRTDENGSFSADLLRPGRWMLSSVMISGEGNRYSSVWTSLTFVVTATGQRK